MANLSINGKAFNLDVEPDTPLLWAIRENVGLTGTKYGCGIAQCGACTVHIDGAAVRSCGMPVSEAVGQEDHHHRGPRRQRHAAQGAAGLDRPRRAAMRLLPERHDHGGGGAAQGQAEADRRRYRRGDHQHLPLRHLPAGARGDPRRRERLRRPAMNHIAAAQSPSLLRHRHRRRRRRPRARPRPSVRRPRGRPRRRRLAGSQCLGRDPARRHRRHPHRALRDGPGHADRSRPAGRRGTRMRLVEGHDRISDAGPERRPQARLGRFLHRRQPRHPHLAGVCAQGRRGRAHDADPGRRQRMEGAGVRMHAPPTASSRTRRPAAPRPTARSPKPRPSSSRRTTSR